MWAPFLIDAKDTIKGWFQRGTNEDSSVTAEPYLYLVCSPGVVTRWSESGSGNPWEEIAKKLKQDCMSLAQIIVPGRENQMSKEPIFHILHSFPLFLKKIN